MSQITVYIWPQPGGGWCWLSPDSMGGWLHTDYRSPAACKLSARNSIPGALEWAMRAPPGDVNWSPAKSFGSRYTPPGGVSPIGKTILSYALVFAFFGAVFLVMLVTQ